MVGFSITFFVPCIFLFLGISWWGNIIYDKKGGYQLLISKNIR
jgi:hypothetical protein